MVSRFRRTLSFPKPITARPFYHVRSVSFPCRSHPLISQLNDDINHLKTWQSQSDDRSSSWICDGMIRLKNLHDSFDDLLQLPKTQESLRRRPDWVENLLEEFIRFVDIYGIFRATLVSIQEEQSSVQVAIRRRDESNIGFYLKNRKKIDKEMKKLVSTVRSIGRCSVSILPESLNSFDEDAELAAVIRDVNEVTVSVTIYILNAISGSPSMTCNSCIGAKLLKKKSKQGTGEGRIGEFELVEEAKFRCLRKKGEKEVRSLLKELVEMENCVVEIESGSGKMFRSLINTRVSLLNILTQ